MYSILLASVPDIANKSRLVVVPDGRLHLLSFDALVDPNGRYLVTTHRITYALSASAFYLLNRTSPAQFDTATLLAIGGVPYDQTASVRVALTRGFSGTTLGNLPGSKDEVLAAADALPSPQNVVLIGPEATEAAFKRARLERRAVIHLAVHGIANEKHPDRAALILLSDAAAEDGILQLSEIVQLRLNADLVVLSACDTAVGRLLGEEGISNISRAFLFEPRQDSCFNALVDRRQFRPTYPMKRFYAHLTAGETTGAALTGAKRDMLNAFGPRAVPYYSVRFVLEGVADRPIGNGKIRGEFAYVTQNDRQKVITSIRKLVPEKHINVLNPDQDYRQWLAFVDSRSRDLLATERSEDFEAGVRALLAALGSSHTAFFRENDHIPAPHAINATLQAVAAGDGARWMFVDVIEDGPAHRGGIVWRALDGCRWSAHFSSGAGQFLSRDK